MCPINVVFMSCKVKKQESPEYYTVVNLKTLGSHLKDSRCTRSAILNLTASGTGVPVFKHKNTSAGILNTYDRVLPCMQISRLPRC